MTELGEDVFHAGLGAGEVDLKWQVNNRYMCLIESLLISEISEINDMNDGTAMDTYLMDR